MSDELSDDGIPLSKIDFQMTLASLSVAEHALREEPYERLPALAGTLAIAAHRFNKLRIEALGLRGRQRESSELVRCLWQQIEYMRGERKKGWDQQFLADEIDRLGFNTTNT